MRCLAILVLIGGVSAGTAFRASPADPASNTQPDKTLSPEQRKARLQELRDKKPRELEKLRKELKDLSPEERRARARELREKQTRPLSRDELEKRRQELKKLPPAERAAKVKELREKLGERPNFKAMTPDQRKLKRNELKKRFEKQLEQLRQKKATASLTPSETKRLQRMEGMAQRFKQARETNSPSPSSTP